MAKYIVSVPFIVWQYIEVEADDAESAIDLASEEWGLNAYAGNGGSGEKLIGVSECNHSVECCDEPFEDGKALKIEATLKAESDDE